MSGEYEPIENANQTDFSEKKEQERSPEDINLYRELDKFQRVDRIEVKRSFVAAQYFRQLGRENTRYLKELTREEFLDYLQQSKEYVSHLSEDELDKFIRDEYPKRLKAYNAADWYVGIIHPDEVGVWKGAGGLPKEWTYGSLEETASKINQDEKGGITKRAKRAIPRIRKNLDLIEKDPYLYPIILPGGTMGRNYKGFQPMKGDIDDGNMRAITLTSSGKTEFTAYIGLKHESTK